MNKYEHSLKNFKIWVSIKDLIWSTFNDFYMKVCFTIVVIQVFLLILIALTSVINNPYINNNIIRYTFCGINLFLCIISVIIGRLYLKINRMTVQKFENEVYPTLIKSCEGSLKDEEFNK